MPNNFFSHLPPELQELLAQQQMQHQNSVNELDDFMFGLEKDHMLILANLLGAIANAGPAASGVANYYEGMIRGTVRERWKVCPMHGVDHDEEALADLQGSTATGDSENDPLDGSNTEGDVPLHGLSASRDEDMASIQRDLVKYRVGFVEDIDIESNDYRVRELRGTKLVTCLDCGISYPSLDDRMVKEPKDCHGCHIKAAHG